MNDRFMKHKMRTNNMFLCIVQTAIHKRYKLELGHSYLSIIQSRH